MSIRINFFKFGALLLASQLLFLQCSPESTARLNNVKSNENRITTNAENISPLSVAPAFDKVDVPFSKHTVKVQEGKKIFIEQTGTIIEIPAFAFVDAHGKAIEGEVEIQFREFHDAAEIIASGIPMHNPETGEYMETAGMFEINGSQNGEAVFVNAEKNIHVQLASYNEGDEFDFFRLDPNGRWDKKEDNVPAKINIVKKDALAKLTNQKPQCPVAPAKFGKTSQFVFDMEVNYSEFPELNMFKDVLWVYAGAASSAENPENSDWIFKTDWTNIALEQGDKEMTYNIVLKNSQKTFKTSVQPVLKGMDYEAAKAVFEQRKKEYDRTLAAVKDRANTLQRQADLTRSYAIDGFGIYNWDIWKDPARMQLQVQLDLGEEYKHLTETNNCSVFLVSDRRKAVVRYNNKYDLDRFSFVRNDKNVLVAVLPDNKVAIYSAKDFLQLQTSSLNNGDRVTLQLKTLDARINSVEDIKAVIDAAS